MSWITSPKSLAIARKCIFALAMTGLFLVLSLVSGFGYRVYSIRQISFVPHSQFGYADAVFQCELKFNPILYLSYWVTGHGYVNESLSMVIIPDSYQPGEFGRPIWGVKESRYGDYIMYVVTSDIGPNVFCILLLTILIEIAGSRESYVSLLSGVLGFAAGDMAGAFIGLLVGAAVGVILLLKRQTLQHFWSGETNEETG